jgi:Zn finger protein HypA/HybF involved in hydrogenase expression
MLREKPLENNKNKGRPSFKVNLGSTSNTLVAHIILDSVLKNKDFEKFRLKIGEVSLANPKSLASAFKKLIKLLEETKIGEKELS